ncbi:MAG TPA: hypothetical protein VNC78_10720 [Actinomycetota bacterium]|nr:hypothetical protein [Actinomycetota bacterium]
MTKPVRAGMVLTIVVALAGALLLPAAPAAAKPGAPSHAPFEKRDNIRITKNEEFTAENGVRSGSGTVADPYVISGWDLNRVEIKDTSAVYSFVDNHVRGQVILNWTGPGLVMQRNTVNDLRVNQNVRRTGDMTSGIISNNIFGIVGQLRHFDGFFEMNRVGAPGTESQRAVNFDGFNGAYFRYNTLYGYLEARLHGHHHSSSFEDDEVSHYHGPAGHHPPESGEPPAPMEDGMDHSQRYHRVFIHDNDIHSTTTYALRYTDTNHAANDRTAASEQNPKLNDPHIHYTRVFIENNDLIGSGLWIDVFNAVDKQKHQGTTRGLVDVRNNTISVGREGSFPLFPPQFQGIVVQKAVDMTVNIADNEITGPPEDDSMLASAGRMFESPTVGIQLRDLDTGEIFIERNSIYRYDIGVEAARFTASVRWVISDLKTKSVGRAVEYDPNNVPNEPEQRP